MARHMPKMTLVLTGRLDSHQMALSTHGLSWRLSAHQNRCCFRYLLQWDDSLQQAITVGHIARRDFNGIDLLYLGLLAWLQQVTPDAFY